MEAALKHSFLSVFLPSHFQFLIPNCGRTDSCVDAGLRCSGRRCFARANRMCTLSLRGCSSSRTPPPSLRPVLDPVSSICHKLLCGRSEGKGQALVALLPSSESVMSNRRRERGQRALEQRSAEKLVAVKSSEGTPLQEDASGKV